MLLEMDTLYTRVASATEDEQMWLREYLAFEDDKARFRHGGGDGKTRMYNLFTETFPTGFIPLVKKRAPLDEVVVQVMDKRRRNVVPDPNADLAWLRDYQRAAVDKVVKIGRGILWCPTGCLVGSTKLIINRGGAARPIELATVVARLRGRATRNNAGRMCSWDLQIPTYTQSVDDNGYVRLNEICAAHDNGVKDVFTVVLASGRTITATAEHHFLTSNGWARLGDLSVGDVAMVTIWPASSARQVKRTTQYAQVGTMWNHPYASVFFTNKNEKVARVALHRLMAEARENSMSLTDFVGHVVLDKTDGLTFLGPEWHVHHRDGNPKNNHPDNLEVLTIREHLAKHGRDGGWKHIAGRACPERIASIEPAGEQHVYDLTMASPMNNYVANEIVVHNSGKTELAVALSRALPGRWLFLAHRSTLMDNAAERFELRTPGGHAGRIGEGSWDVRPDDMFISATFQTLLAQRRTAPLQMRGFFNSLDGIIVDECHVLPADTFWSLAMDIPAFYRVGLSGTPLARGDQRSLLAIAALGPVIYRIHSETLIKAGVLARPRIKMIRVKQRSLRPSWQGVYGEAVVRSEVRNRTLVECAKAAEKPCLLFVKEVKHGTALKTRLEKAGLRADFVFGKDDLADRKGAVKRLVRGDLDVLVCSVVFQEGIDIPQLRSVVIGSGGKSIIAALQRIGRGMRKAAGKEEFEVWDIADEGCGCPAKGGHAGCKWLTKHTSARRNAFLGEGFQTSVLPSVL